VRRSLYLVNGTVIIDMSDSRSLSGWLGLSTYNEKAEFDSLSAYEDSLVVDPASKMPITGPTHNSERPIESPVMNIMVVVTPHPLALFVAGESLTAEGISV